MMIVSALVLVLGVAVLCCAHTVPLAQVKISDNGMRGYILHEEDDQKSGLQQGHTVHPRSVGSKLESDKSAAVDDSEEDLVRAESYFPDYSVYPYGAGFHSFLPYPPPHHGPHPGGYSPPFGQEHHQFPGSVPQNGWDNSFGPPGRGRGRGHGHGFGHGHGPFEDSGWVPPGHRHGHPGQGNAFGHGNGQGQGHGHGPGHGRGQGQGHGHGHGHEHGGGPGDLDCDDDDNNGHGGELNHMQTTPPHVAPTTEKDTHPPTQPPAYTTTHKVTTPSTTEGLIYDIDVRLGSSDRK